MDIFGQRLLKSERSDIQKFLDFWEIDPKFKDDKYYMLAYTQGMLSTDNFEFLADFHPIKDLCFVSEISGLSATKLDSGVLMPGDLIRWELEKNNQFDKTAVKVFKESIFLGYVKLIHCKVFHKPSKNKLSIKVKSIDQNGTINRIFIKISF